MDDPKEYPTQQFTATLQREPDSSATFIAIPFLVKDVFGSLGRVPVRGTINGTAYRTSLFPYGGVHYMGVNRDLREKAGIKAGDRVEITMEYDDEPRIIDIPGDLLEAFDRYPAAKVRWDKLSFSHRREFVEAILAAKKPETRSRRIEQTIQTLLKPYKKLA